MTEFKAGVYDQLMTRRLREFLDHQSGLKSSVDALEETDCPDYLARHLIRQIKSALRGMPTEDRQRRQVELANTLLEFLKAHGTMRLNQTPSILRVRSSERFIAVRQRRCLLPRL